MPCQTVFGEGQLQRKSQLFHCSCPSSPPGRSYRLLFCSLGVIQNLHVILSIKSLWLRFWNSLQRSDPGPRLRITWTSAGRLAAGVYDVKEAFSIDDQSPLIVDQLPYLDISYSPGSTTTGISQSASNVHCLLLVTKRSPSIPP